MPSIVPLGTLELIEIVCDRDWAGGTAGGTIGPNPSIVLFS
jgi:hypothetical protein